MRISKIIQPCVAEWCMAVFKSSNIPRYQLACVCHTCAVRPNRVYGIRLKCLFKQLLFEGQFRSAGILDIKPQKCMWKRVNVSLCFFSNTLEMLFYYLHVTYIDRYTTRNVSLKITVSFSVIFQIFMNYANISVFVLFLWHRLVNLGLI